MSKYETIKSLLSLEKRSYFDTFNYLTTKFWFMSIYETLKDFTLNCEYKFSVEAW